MTPAEITAWVAKTRARQGLPPTISDPATLATLAALVADTMVLAGTEGDSEGGGGRAPSP